MISATRVLKVDCHPPRRWVAASKKLGISKGYCEQPLGFEGEEKKPAKKHHKKAEYAYTKELPTGKPWGTEKCRYIDPSEIKEVTRKQIDSQTYDMESEIRFIENGLDKKVWESKSKLVPHPKNKFLDIKLSRKTEMWLNDYLDGVLMFEHNKAGLTDTRINAELQQFKSGDEILLFRGLHFSMLDFENLKKFCLFPLDKSSLIEYSNINPTSWTWNYNMAENFAKMGSFNFIIARWFKPEEILIDLR